MICALQKKLAALQTLELFNCDLAQSEEYRDKIFDMLESVLYVDGFDRDGEPAPDEDEADDYDGEGSSLKVLGFCFLKFKALESA